jgi:hypothetical protein
MTTLYLIRGKISAELNNPTMVDDTTFIGGVEMARSGKTYGRMGATRGISYTVSADDYPGSTDFAMPESHTGILGFGGLD